MLTDHLVVVDKAVAYMRQRIPRYVDPEDLHAVALLALVECRDKYDETRGVPFAAFAYQRMWDDRRSQRWGGRGQPIPPLLALLNLDTECPTTNSELSMDMDTALHTLSKRCETVLRLYYWQGKTLAEIGEHLGCTESRCSQLRKEGLTLLATTIGNDYKGSN